VLGIGRKTLHRKLDEFAAHATDAAGSGAK